MDEQNINLDENNLINIEALNYFINRMRRVSQIPNSYFEIEKDKTIEINKFFNKII